MKQESTIGKQTGRRWIAAWSEWGDGDVPFSLEPSSPARPNILLLTSAALSLLFATSHFLQIPFHASSDSSRFRHSHLRPPCTPMTLFPGLMIFLTTTSSNPGRTMDRKKSLSRPSSFALGLLLHLLLLSVSTICLHGAVFRFSFFVFWALLRK